MVTAYAAGRLLGGTVRLKRSSVCLFMCMLRWNCCSWNVPSCSFRNQVWRIAKDAEDIVYAVDYNQMQDR